MGYDSSVNAMPIWSDFGLNLPLNGPCSGPVAKWNLGTYRDTLGRLAAKLSPSTLLFAKTRTYHTASASTASVAFFVKEHVKFSAPSMLLVVYFVRKKSSPSQWSQARWIEMSVDLTEPVSVVV